MNQPISSVETVVPLTLSVPDRDQRPEEANELRRDYVATVRAGLDTLSARLIALLAVLGGIAIWAWAVVNPGMWGFIIGCGYSAGCILPSIWLHSKKG